MLNSTYEIANFYDQFLTYLNYSLLVIDGFLLLFFSWFYIYCLINSFKKNKKFEPKENVTKFAVLVAARDESAVVSNLLKSLKNQKYPKNLFDVYVIVESKKDKSVNITYKYGYKVIIREEIEGKRTKGYALDDAYKYLERHKLSYDAYLIFDADNIVSPDYLSAMNTLKQNGYDIGMGYRNFTNLSKNWLTITSGILFSFMDIFSTNGKSKLFHKVQLTGTGYFVDSKIVKDAGGWIWNGMTEDVELTYYAHKNNIKMKYYPFCEYFDEQAGDFETMHNQHIRWIWGYISDKKEKFKEYKFDYDPDEDLRNKIARIENNISVYPFVIFVILEVLTSFIDLLIGIYCSIWVPSIAPYAFIYGAYHILIVYFTFVFIAIFTISLDRKHLKLGFKNSLKGIFMFPFFFLDFLLAFLDGLFHQNKRNNWLKTKHSGEVLNKEANNIK